jgi:hypothetical protein
MLSRRLSFSPPPAVPVLSDRFREADARDAGRDARDDGRDDGRCSSSSDDSEVRGADFLERVEPNLDFCGGKACVDFCVGKLLGSRLAGVLRMKEDSCVLARPVCARVFEHVEVLLYEGDLEREEAGQLAHLHDLRLLDCVHVRLNLFRGFLAERGRLAVVVDFNI